MTLTELPVLRSARITLRRPRPDDVAARLQLGGDAEIHRMYGGSLADLRPLTEEAARRWLERLLDHDHAWIIEAGALIGAIRLHSVDFKDRRASLAVGIEDKTRLGIGLGPEAIGLVLNYAFRILELHRLSVRVVAYNTRAIRAYQSAVLSSKGPSVRPHSSTAPGTTTS